MWHFSNVYLSSFWDLYLFIIAGSWFSIQCSLQPALQPFWPQCILYKPDLPSSPLCRGIGESPTHLPGSQTHLLLEASEAGNLNKCKTCSVILDCNVREGTEVVSKTCLEIFVRDFHIQDLFWSLGLSCVKFHCSAKTFSHAQPSADIWKGSVLYLVKISSKGQKKKHTWPPSCPGWVESQSYKNINLS